MSLTRRLILGAALLLAAASLAYFDAPAIMWVVLAVAASSGFALLWTTGPPFWYRND